MGEVIFASPAVYIQNLLVTYAWYCELRRVGEYGCTYTLTCLRSHHPYTGLLTHHFFHLSHVTENAAVLKLHSELFTVPDNSVSLMLWGWRSKKKLMYRCLCKYHEKVLLLFFLLLILCIWFQESYQESSREHSYVLEIICAGRQKQYSGPASILKSNIVVCNTGNHRMQWLIFELCRFWWDWFWLPAGGQKLSLTHSFPKATHLVAWRHWNM